jgi:hypothetical protein
VNATTMTAGPQPVQTPLLSVRALGHVLVLSALAAIGLAAFVLLGLGGWAYYSEPAAVRGYNSLHRLLRPSGTFGQPFGIAGFVLMLVPVAYSLRKKISRLRNLGSKKTWLEVHIFCGIVGPVLVTFHTSFRFNGIVAVAYWSMVTVVLSGFVGRYLYVRIPRSLRGLELTRAELDARARELSARLTEAALPPALLSIIAAFEQRVVPAEESSTLPGLIFGELRLRRELSVLQREIAGEGVSASLMHEIADVIAERATLLRRGAYLKVTKTLFDVWHVFHMPLVYVMFIIVVLHVAVTLYMGYVPFVH